MANQIYCAICGCELEPEPKEADFIPPPAAGSKVVVVSHLCDECWTKLMKSPRWKRLMGRSS